MFGAWRAIERFKLEIFHIATKAEALIMHSNCLSGIKKEKIATALDKTQSEGIAPEDILNDEFQPKTKSSKKSRQKRPNTKNSK